MISGIIILSLLFTASCGTQVKWSISLPNECVANDTMTGVCTRSRTVQCVKTLSGQHVPDYYCNAVSPKPESFIKCDNQKCPARCVVSMWSPWQSCDSACSRSFTYRTRSILSRDHDAVECPPLLEKSPCTNCPFEFYLWKVGSWGTCRAFTKVTVYNLNVNQSHATASGSNVCGRDLKIGKATRKVKCVDINGVEKRARKCLNSKDKDGRITQRPDRSKVCQFSCDCHMSDWSAWSGCPNECSRTEESRTRRVLYSPQLGGKECGKLVEKRVCNTRNCPRYTWYTSSWGDCEGRGDGNSCGFKRRAVFCVESTDVNQPIEEEMCEDASKPVAWQQCKECPRDCVVSGWSAWGSCSVSCGKSGVKRRVRTVVQMPQYGGAECPSLAQMALCQEGPCAWWTSGVWSSCRSTGHCGIGMNHRVVYCAGMGGIWLKWKECAYQPMPPPTKNCTVPCPNDCVLSDWGAWGACSKSCGTQGGVQTRKRSIVATPTSLRPACPSDHQLTETQKCNVNILCESEAAYMWKFTPWGSCDVHVNGTCGIGKGIKRRQLHCGNDIKNFDNHTLCSNLTQPAAELACDIPCPKDCILSKWTPWSKCNTHSQRQKTQISRRYVLQKAADGGKTCPVGVLNGVELKMQPCGRTLPTYNYTWDVTPWQDCLLLPHSKSTPPTCGSGYQIRNISCKRSDGKLMEISFCFESSLENPPRALKECWKPCDDYCVRSSWSEWSKCPNVCTRSPPVRDRSRQVVNLSPARGGFSATCPPLTALDFTETEDCPKIPCKSYKWYPTSFGSCIPVNSVTYCGQGQKERHVMCQDQSDMSFVAESFCDESKKPSSREDCTVQCTEDCVVSSWGEWDLKCSNSCGDSLQTRYRTVLKPALGLGRACPSLVDKQLCHEPACTSFKWSMGIWGTCELSSKGSTCGNGTQARKVVCSPDPVREWICLKQAPKPVTSQECNLVCPGDCVMSTWGEWSQCTQGFDSCMQKRWRRPLRNEHATSVKKCIGFKTAQERNCSCLSAGKVAVSDWSTCQLNQTLGVNCGTGMQYRSVECKSDNGIVLDNAHCPKIATMARSRDCQIACPVDCVVANWGKWSSCTSACGLDGKIQRSRKVIIDEQNGGRRCPEIMQYRPCNGVPCYGYSLIHGAWSKCYVDGQGCGTGSQTRESNCRRSDGEIVSLHFCFGQLKKSSDGRKTTLELLQYLVNNSSQISFRSSRSCDVPCPGDCFMSPWSTWSECARNCFESNTKYRQSRSRVVILPAKTGGKACSSELSQTQECQPLTTQCMGARWRTASWLGNGTRAVWCETSSGTRVTGACSAQNKPSDTKSCSPNCSDSNSICREGQCTCKLNYELFQHQCIPTHGCLFDGHCIQKNTVCQSQKCVCVVNYIWNSTTGSCMLAKTTLTQQPTMASNTVSTRLVTTMKADERSTKVSTVSAKTTLTQQPTMASNTVSTRLVTTMKTDEHSTKVSTVVTGRTTENAISTSAEKEIIILRPTEEEGTFKTENVHEKAHLKNEEETISPEFWKWIGIGVGALVFFLFLAIGVYCYTRRQRKGKHTMMRLKRNTIELVGVLTFADGEKAEKV